MKPLALLTVLTATGVSLVAQNGPVPVQLEQTEAGYRLLREGKPYFIKGAGGDREFPLLAEAGANSLRTWGADQLEALLEPAHQAGLTVTAGLWIEHERHGFDYGDPEAVAAQIKRHQAVVDRYKDHPALLLWAVGNEVSINATHAGVWDTIEAVARYIKEVDPHHPVMTVLPHVSKEEVRFIQQRCPSIDILGFNAYAGISVVARDALKAGWRGPFIIAEWGPDGNWEVPQTDWGAEIEASSTVKARQYRERYRYILDHPRSLGSYAFFWGQKQETTPTWFNLFTPDGLPTEIIDELQFLWSGSYPENRAPGIEAFTLNGQHPADSITVDPRSSLEAVVRLLKGRGAGAAFQWFCLPESTDKRLGGDRESVPPAVDLEFENGSRNTVRFTAPEEPGPYRLYVTVKSPEGRAAVANIPFRVRQERE